MIKIILLFVITCGSLFSQDNFIYSWGLNTSGQLGQKNSVSKSAIVAQVSNIKSWDKMSAGGYHCLAFKVNGRLWAWGNNQFGQLGNGTTNTTNYITVVNDDKDWKELATGEHHSLALKTDGTLWAWGDNQYGQLGDGTILNKSKPIKIGTDNDWVGIFTTYNHSFAIKTDGTLWAWGLNNYGQLGDGTKINKNTPTQIGTDNKWLKVSAGQHFTVAIKTDGTMWTWGQNNAGQLGNYGSNDEIEPVEIGYNNPFKWKDISCGVFHALAIDESNSLWSWGNNDVGKLGRFVDGNNPNNAPGKVGVDDDWAKIDCGYYHSVAMKSNGAIYSCGENNESQLGISDNENDDKDFLTIISTSLDFNDISVGGFHNIAYSSTSNIPFYTISGKISENGNGLIGINISNEKKIVTTDSNGSYVFEDIEEGIYMVSPLDASYSYDYPNMGIWLSQNMSDLNFVADKKVGQYLYSWGKNVTGQLGDNTKDDRFEPTLVDTNKVWYKVTAGEEHSVAIKADGTLWAWGGNSFGQLGNNSNIDELKPIQIGTDNDWKDVSCGGFHNIALKTNGTIWSWGNNLEGQLGIDSFESKNIPTQIGVDNDWEKIYAGGDHSLAIRFGSTIWAWGLALNGELGTGASQLTDRQVIPKKIGDDNDWIEICAGDHFSVALKQNGSLWTTGDNTDGQLGNGTQISSDIFKQVGSDLDWKEVACGSSSVIALKTDNSLYGWGLNVDRQLSVPNIDNQLNPVRIGTESDWSKIGVGFLFSMAIKNDGTIWLTGSNYHGEQGAATNGDEFTKLGEENDWVSSNGGAFHALGLKSSIIKNGFNISGKILENGYGVEGVVISNGSATVSTNTLGEYIFESLDQGSYTITPTHNSYTFAPEFFEVDLIADVLDLEFDAKQINNNNNNNTLFLHSWGNNTNGNLGLGDMENRDKPTAISENNEWHFISTSYKSCLAIKTNGTLWGWGLNDKSQLGLADNLDRDTPTQVGTDDYWDRVDAGAFHTLAIKRDGTLWAWGDNQNGKLGLGDEINRDVPTQVGTDNDWVAISAGIYQSLAIKSDGTLWAWGDNSYGLLGLGDLTNRDIPVQVGTDNNWAIVSAGDFHTIALKFDRTLWSWGSNGAGQLGHNDFIQRESPTQVGIENNWNYISAGGEYSLAQKQDGTLWSWGRNASGQLGLDDNVDRGIPTQVGTDTDWFFMSANDFHNLALKENGTLWGWGSNSEGQLDLEDKNDKLIPTLINSDNDWRFVETGDNFSLAKKETKVEYYYSISGKIVNTDAVGLYAIEVSNGSKTVTTDIQGNYEFLDLLESSYTITPIDTAYKFDPPYYEIDLSQDTTEFNFNGTDIINNFSIAGIIYENGVGLGDIVISNGSSTVNTNVVGEYFFSNLDAGSYTLTPISEGYTYNPKEYIIDLTQDTTLFDFDAIEILNTYAIRGRITENGVGLYAIEISNGSKTVSTDIQGNYEFLNLTEGTYNISPINPDYTFSPISYNIFLTQDTTLFDFEATEKKNFYSISGKVTQNGVGLENISISNGSSTVTTDISGNYIFNSIEEGTYIITPFSSNYSFNPSSYNIDLTMDTTLFNFDASIIQVLVSGRVIDESSNPIENVLVDLGNNISTLTNSNGDYSFSLLEGNYNIFYSLNKYEFTPNNIYISSPKQDTVIQDVIGKLINTNDCIQVDQVDMGITIYNPNFETELVESIKIVNECNAPLTVTNITLDALTSSEFTIISQQQLPVVLQQGGTDTITITVKYIPQNLGKDIGKINIETNLDVMKALVIAEAIEFDDNTKVSFLRIRPSANQVENGDKVTLFLEVYDKQNIFNSMDWKLDIGIDARLAAGLKFYYPSGALSRAQEVYISRNINLKEFSLRGTYDPSLDSVLGRFEFTAALAETDTLFINNGAFRWLTDSIVVKPAFNDYVHIIPCDVGGKRLLKRKNIENEAFINSIYPQPSSGKVTLNINAFEGDKISVIGVEGNVYKTIDVNYRMTNEDYDINLNDLNNGIYIIELSSKNNIETEKIIIKK